MTSATSAAKRHVRRTFAWRDGHAQFTPVFQDPVALRSLGPALAEPFRGVGVTAVVSPEARGFILGALTATELGVGFVPARKPGARDPDDSVHVTSEPDWRGRRITFRLARVFGPADRILIVDDWIETGSQATAVAQAIRQMGAEVVGTSVLVDQAPEAVVAELRVSGVLKHDELPE